jgi:hypothetical protein
MTPAWTQLEQAAAALAPADVFRLDDAEGHPDTVGRYLTAAIAPGTSLAPGARLSMQGSIKIGRWLPFRARQLLVPRLGTVWEARVAGVISGSDRYVAGRGGMDWKALGLARLVRAEGPDVSRSAAERAAGESIWVPTVLARTGDAVRDAPDGSHVTVELETDGHMVVLEHEIDAVGQLRRSHFQRWGDPDNTGRWQLHPFGVEVTGHATFGGGDDPESRTRWLALRHHPVGERGLLPLRDHALRTHRLRLVMTTL